jgi:hypothetical protein
MAGKCTTTQHTTTPPHHHNFTKHNTRKLKGLAKILTLFSTTHNFKEYSMSIFKTPHPQNHTNTTHHTPTPTNTKQTTKGTSTNHVLVGGQWGNQISFI